jgi:uncharacterized RDD family membrane protein YckC
MSASLWYYVDRQQERQGPVAAETIRDAYRSKQIDGDSLVWREGMSQWMPLRQFELEFDLEDEPASLAMPPPVAEVAADAATPVYASPYAPPTAAVEVAGGFNPDTTDIVYAGFWRRFLAYCVDGFLVSMAYYAVYIVLIFALGLGSAFMGGSSDVALQGQMLLFGVLSSASYLVISALYFVLQESSTAQATLGKRLLGIKVTDNEGNRLSRAHALGRWASHLVSYATFYIGYVMAGFTERKRGLHDMVAGTLVVDQWAYTDRPELQKRELGGCLVAAIVGMFVLVLTITGLMIFAVMALADGFGGFH